MYSAKRPESASHEHAADDRPRRDPLPVADVDVRREVVDEREEEQDGHEGDRPAEDRPDQVERSAEAAPCARSRCRAGRRRRSGAAARPSSSPVSTTSTIAISRVFQNGRVSDSLVRAVHRLDHRAHRAARSPHRTGRADEERRRPTPPFDVSAWSCRSSRARRRARSGEEVAAASRRRPTRPSRPTRKTTAGKNASSEL